MSVSLTVCVRMSVCLSVCECTSARVRFVFKRELHIWCFADDKRAVMEMEFPTFVSRACDNGDIFYFTSQVL